MQSVCFQFSCLNIKTINQTSILKSQYFSIYLICSLLAELPCSARLSERHVLVGAEESHELWHLDELNESSLVDIEVTPGLGEVSVDVVIEHLARETLVGSEDLLGGREGRGLVHPELSAWLTTSLKSIGVLSDLGSLLKGVLLDHRSHEDIIGVSRESGGGDSLVVGGLVVEWSVVGWNWVEFLVNGGSTSEANQSSNGEFHVSSLN